MLGPNLFGPNETKLCIIMSLILLSVKTVLTCSSNSARKSKISCCVKGVGYVLDKKECIFYGFSFFAHVVEEFAHFVAVFFKPFCEFELYPYASYFHHDLAIGSELADVVLFVDNIE